MDDSNSKVAAWTEIEKLSFIVQLIDRLGKIPWDELELPAGRTRKACQVMLDREKKKVRDAKEQPEQKTASKRKSAGTEKTADTKKAKKVKNEKVKDEEAEDDVFA